VTSDRFAASKGAELFSHEATKGSRRNSYFVFFVASCESIFFATNFANRILDSRSDFYRLNNRIQFCEIMKFDQEHRGENGFGRNHQGAAG